MRGVNLDTYGVRMVTDTLPKRIADVIVGKMNSLEQTILGLSTETGIPRTTLKRRLRTGAGLEVAELHAIAEALGTTMVAIIEAAIDDPRAERALAGRPVPAPATAFPAASAPLVQELLDHEAACDSCWSLDDAAEHLGLPSGAAAALAAEGAA